MRKVEYSEEKVRNQDVKIAKQQKQHKIELSLREGSKPFLLTISNFIKLLYLVGICLTDN